MRRNSVLVLVAAVLVVASLLSGCTAVPAPAPVPTLAPGTTPFPAPDLWEQIQKDGVLRVGTSGDYPPFEYYDRRYRLDGFDVALIREIGKQLGVEVELKDYAFDGLYNALQLGSIDTAIAAISVTPDRLRYVDFTDVYYAGKGAAIADPRSSITEITEIGQLADKIVGVQSGSVYEKYANTALVATKLMPAKNLRAYPDVEQAVKDLQRGRLDVMVLDAQPAEAFVKQGGVKVVGEGVNPQMYAMAYPKGADSLGRVLNKALATLIADGTYAKLTQEYLGLGPQAVQPLPTPQPMQPTPAVTAAPVPTQAPAGCIDNMAYVADLNYDDKNMTAPPVLPPGQTFTKSWRIRNSGTCSWDSTYYLGYASGNSSLAQMGGQPTYIKGTVAPGATYDISVQLTAPTQPGVYQGFWQMNNGQSKAFGTKIYVGIQVQAPTPVPAPTQTPSPTINFTVDTTNITAGQCVVFTWNVQNIKAVYFYAQGQNPQDHGVAGQGSQTECPPQTTTYYLSVTYTNNTTETRAITINVTPAQVDAPVINLFVVTPPGIAPGQCVNIQWDVRGSVQKITLARGSTSLWDGAPLQGTLQDCPPGTGNLGYSLVASGPGGQATGQQYVYVTVPPTAVPPTAVPPTAVPPTAVPPTAVPPTAVPPTAVPQPPAIVGKNWMLTTYNNGQGGMTTPIVGTQITALFGADGKLTGSDGCNTYNAPYSASTTTVTVGLPITTGMACPEDVAQQGQLYLAALQTSQTYQVAGTKLTIFSPAGQKILEYVAQ